MCGFLAEYVFSNQVLSEPEVFADLLALSKKRGPDATGILRDANIQLGFNRLSILDLSVNGNQPKQSPTRRYQVVFNGEIYNYQDLAKAHNLTNLTSTSDTEVLVHLFDAIGVEKTIKSLNGMFSITGVDSITGTFFMARDFAGIKPLYYGLYSNGVVAASQFNQIFKHNWFSDSLKLRPEIVKEYFGFGYMQAPNTIYQNIFQVNPGNLVTIDVSGKFIETPITIFRKNHSVNPDEENEELSFKLMEAVKRQLVSDVPVATFLSGGIDSPLIASYAKKNKTDIEAFTLKVDDPQLNESDIAMAYAKYLDIKQHIVSVKERDILSCIDEHFIAFTEPFGDYSSIPTYLITKEAKKRHTVMLSGDGGDELFFGYPRMRDILNKRLWFKLPYVIRKNTARFTNTLGITNTWAPYFKSFDEFITNKHLHLPLEVLNITFPKIEFSKATKHLYSFQNSSRKTLLHHLRWNEFYAHLQRVLIKVDRASMQHSLEVRVPFLDKEIINYSWHLTEELNSKTDLKKELKNLLRKELPDELINSKKMGFSVPLKKWLQNELQQDVKKHIFELPFYGNDLMNVSALRIYTQDFFDNKHQDAWGIWHIYAWQKWAVTHLLVK